MVTKYSRLVFVPRIEEAGPLDRLLAIRFYQSGVFMAGLQASALPQLIEDVAGELAELTVRI
jgi:hypothetical protein